MSRALLIGTALSLALGAVAMAQPATREVGNIVYDGAPATPPALQAAIAPYYNARSAVFEDWLPDGSMLIATRFGDTTQIHRVQRPGADRTQLTFFGEPIAEAHVRPGTQTFLYPRDVGGAEYYQAYLRDLAGRETQITAPGARNQNFVFSGDGKLVAWTQVTPGDPNYDILLADPSNPSGRRVVLEGKGAMAPLDISADGRTILAARQNAATYTELFALDVATGALTPLGPKRPIGYQGGAFLDGGAGVLTLSDDGAEFTRPVVIDVKTGKVRDLDPGAAWGAESFGLSPDGKTVALSVNEEGYSTLVLRDVATGRRLPGPRLPQGVLTGFRFSPDGTRIGFSLSTSTGSGDVWSYDLASGELTRWTAERAGGPRSGQPHRTHPVPLPDVRRPADPRLHLPAGGQGREAACGHPDPRRSGGPGAAQLQSAPAVLGERTGGGGDHPQRPRLLRLRQDLPGPRQRREARGLGQGHRRPARLDRHPARPRRQPRRRRRPVVRRLHGAGRRRPLQRPHRRARSTSTASPTGSPSCRTPRAIAATSAAPSTATNAIRR